MTAARADRYARLFLLLFLILGTIYSAVNPVMESPDEVYHYPLVKHLADGHGLPVQRQDVETLYAQEGSQPPLYYALMAGLTCWLDTDDLPALRYLNPHARPGIPLAIDNKNMVVHTPREQWPWRRATLAIHLIRLVSVALGAGTVWCGYRLARRLFPLQPLVALATLAFIAFNPMFAFISASVNNDNLVILLTSITLLRLIRLLQEGAHWRDLVLLGALCGLAALSKLSGLVLLPLTALALALRGWREWRADGGPLGPHVRRLLLRGVVVSGIAALLAGWWYARNWRLYGELTGTETMLDIFGRRDRPTTLADAWQEFRGFRQSWWGLFGYFNVMLRPAWLYNVLDALSLACAAGFVLWLYREWRGQVAQHWPELALLGALVLAIAVSLLRWTSMTMASQGRLFFPAITALAVFAALGLQTLVRPRWQGRAIACLAGGLFVLSATAPFTAIQPAYHQAKVMTLAEVPAELPRIQAIFGDAIRLVAYEAAPAVVAPGETLQVTLYWECLRPVPQDYSAYIHVFGLGGTKIAQRDSFPGMGYYAPTLWQPGQVVRDRYDVTIAPDATGPVAAEIEVGLYDLDTMDRLEMHDGTGQAISRVVVGRVKVNTPTTAVQPAQQIDALLGERVRLRGFDLDQSSVLPGQQLTLTLYWEALGSLPTDYTVFVHLVGEDGALVGQGDGPPLDNAYPTSYWAAGDHLIDTHVITVSADAPSGRARLQVGLYDPATGQRLPLGTNPEGVVELATLSIVREPEATP